MNQAASGAFRVGPARLAAGHSSGPLVGQRLVVKDVLDVAGHRTGAGNPTFLADAPVAQANAEAVDRFLRAGATVVGKTHTDEVAFSLFGTNIHYGTPENPRAPGHVPGGSSSGSASAVAAGLADIGLGTDTGGSIRVPASYCGIWGFRPTHGRVPVTGVVALAPSFDTVGLLAASGRMLARAGRALLGDPVGDARTLRGLVVADDLLEGVDDDVAVAIRAGADRLGRRLGVAVTRARFAGGNLETWYGEFRRRQLWEAWAVHGRWIEARRPVFGPGVADRFARAREATSPPPLEPFRAQVIQALSRVIPPGALMVLPAAGTVAPRIGKGTIGPDLRERTLRLTCVAGVGGLPAVSLPEATVGGLPLGLGLVGRPGDDELLLAVADGRLS